MVMIAGNGLMMFGVNKAYTLLGEFMKANNIEFSKFTYT